MSNSPLNTFETFQTGTDINSQLTTIMKLKKENHLLGQSTINKVESKSRKEHLIIDLRKDCEYYELEQVKREQNYETLCKLRQVCEQNKAEVTKYCDSLRAQLKDFVEKVDFYEGKISKLKEQRQQIIRSSEALINQKKQERAKLEEQLMTIDMKIEKQMSQITALNSKCEELNTQKENEKKTLLEEESKAVDKYNVLFKKYRDMLSKYNVYEQEESDKEINDISSIRKAYEANLIKEDLNIKLTEVKLKNEVLQKELGNNTSKVSSFTQAMEERERSKMLLFGGHIKNTSSFGRDNTNTGRFSTVFTTIGNEKK